eukprot:CAMPEP_0119142818 /NCGR_PEP_ID=MMETSP1310-20130426/33338_1 /TAXON_ID=464262 /ORGANISM="Genus nov. species nov., Strain RCC2339" /LENGTH=498 /DNA_ID=CAMNT_0007134391 /DNA_START=55 /DNA_END=1548 /DNA_ORIENTATION=-
MLQTSYFLIIVLFLLFSPKSCSRCNVPHPNTIKRDINGIDSKVFKSQSQEDTFLLTVFDFPENGTYIEAGALDGVKFSNTYAFWKAFGWSGLLVEPNPISFQRLQSNRRQDKLVNSALCTQNSADPLSETNRLRLLSHGMKPCESGFLHFLYYNRTRAAVSGFLEFMSDGFWKSWFQNSEIPFSLICIPCTSLQSIFDRNDITCVDFVSLDVEQAEYSILQGIDFNKFRASVWLIEAGPPEKDENIRQILQQNGYIYLGLLSRSLWFVSKEKYFLQNDLQDRFNHLTLKNVSQKEKGEANRHVIEVKTSCGTGGVTDCLRESFVEVSLPLVSRNLVRTSKIKGFKTECFGNTRTVIRADADDMRKMNWSGQNISVCFKDFCSTVCVSNTSITLPNPSFCHVENMWLTGSYDLFNETDYIRTFVSDRHQIPKRVEIQNEGLVENAIISPSRWPYAYYHVFFDTLMNVFTALPYYRARNFSFVTNVPESAYAIGNDEPPW